MNTKNAAMIPPGMPKTKYPIDAINVPADASGEHKMFPWKNPPAMIGIVVVATGASDVSVRLNLLHAVQTLIGDKNVPIQILSGI